MNKRLKRATALGLCVLGVLLIATEASALPTFARKYKTSCITCHEAFPTLNAVGESFRLNGFAFVDDELYIKEEPVEMGDEAYKRLWPKQAVWPSDIPAFAPLSLKLTSDLEFDIGGSGEARTQFVFPSEGKLLGAGKFGENMSFFMELVFSQGGGSGHGHGADEEEGALATSLEGWLQFEDMFGAENALNLRVGTVGMQEFGLFTARDHNRLTLTPYLYSSWSFPAFDDHLVEEILGAGDVEGNPFSIHAQPGIELNGFGKHWRYAVGVVNGNGSVSDNNSEKDIYLQLAYKAYGRNFDGSSKEGGSPMGSGDPWRDDSLTLSLFGYLGTGTVKLVGFERDDDFWRFGPGVKWKFRDLTLNAGYIFGSNEKPYGPLSNESVDSESWFIEAQYVVLPWLFPSIRYEGLKLDLASGIPSLFIQEHQDRQRIVVGTKALLRANVTLAVEGIFYTNDERSTRGIDPRERNDANKVVMSLSYAF